VASYHGAQIFRPSARRRSDQALAFKGTTSRGRRPEPADSASETLGLPLPKATPELTAGKWSSWASSNYRTGGEFSFNRPGRFGKALHAAVGCRPWLRPLSPYRTLLEHGRSNGPARPGLKLKLAHTLPLEPR